MNLDIDTAAQTNIDLTHDVETSNPQDVSLTPETSSATVTTASIPAKSGALPAHIFSTSSDSANALNAAAVILVHDAFGPDAWTHQAASRLALAGFAVVAPDLFANATAPADDGDVARQDFLLAQSDSRIVADLLSTVDWLVERGSVAIGIIGWGWGGSYALMAAAHDARLRACVDIAGTVSYPVSTPNRLGSPLNFVADLEGLLLAAFPGDDPQFPSNEIERLRGRLIEHDKNGEIKVYPSAPPHFWQDESSPHTLLLWRRIMAFLQDNLMEDNEDNPAFGDGYPNEESRLHA